MRHVASPTIGTIIMILFHTHIHILPTQLLYLSEIRSIKLQGLVVTGSIGSNCE